MSRPLDMSSPARILDTVAPRNAYAAALLLGLTVRPMLTGVPGAARLDLATATLSVNFGESCPEEDIHAGIRAELERVLRPFTSEVA